MTKCPVKFVEIKLIWRPAPHTERMIVGTLRRVDETFAFRYDGPDLSRARSLGFKGYPGLPQVEALYNGQAMSSFASRLPGRDRPDFATLVGAWDGHEDMSDFELLGLTCGRLPTDMFEFIPVVVPEKGASFLTDLAGIQNYAASEAFRKLQPGANLELRANPANSFDKFAVEVLHGGQQVAHIKKVHSQSVATALREGLQMECLLERVRLNGIIREVLVRIRYD